MDCVEDAKEKNFRSSYPAQLNPRSSRQPPELARLYENAIMSCRFSEQFRGMTDSDERDAVRSEI